MPPIRSDLRWLCGMVALVRGRPCRLGRPTSRQAGRPAPGVRGEANRIVLDERPAEPPGSEGRSEYWNRGMTALKNQALVVVGTYGYVTTPE
jgi:hypothetical protein